MVLTLAIFVSCHKVVYPKNQKKERKKKQMQTNHTSEKGITLIALLIMIIILIILTAVVLGTITGDEPLIGTATDTAQD